MKLFLVVSPNLSMKVNASASIKNNNLGIVNELDTCILYIKLLQLGYEFLFFSIGIKVKDNIHPSSFQGCRSLPGLVQAGIDLKRSVYKKKGKGAISNKDYCGMVLFVSTR